LDVPLPTYPYQKSLYKPYIIGICGFFHPQESLENTRNNPLILGGSSQLVSGSPPFRNHDWPFERGPTTLSLGDENHHHAYESLKLTGGRSYKWPAYKWMSLMDVNPK